MLTDRLPRLGTRAGEGTSPERWLYAVSLGVCGFILNSLPISISPGVDVVLGGAFVFAAFRLLSPAQFIFAFSLAAAQTTLLWGHAWAWLIWTLEGAFLAWRRNESSPIISDVIFWVLGGALLIWVTYGQVMNMDELSLQLTILKQAINAVINVTLGEIIYILLGYVLKQKLKTWTPRVSVGSIILPVLIALFSMPAILLMRTEAGAWDRTIRKSAELRLTDNLDENQRDLAEWKAESASLHIDAAQQRQQGSLKIDVPKAASGTFSEVAVIGEAELESRGKNPNYPIGTSLISRENARPLALDADLVIANQESSWTIGKLRENALKSVIKPAKINKSDGIVLLTDPNGRIAAASGVALPDTAMLTAILGAPQGRVVRVSPPRAFGTPLMNRTREAAYVMSAPVAGSAGWRIVSASWVRTEILDQRRAQSRLLTAVAIGIISLTFLSGYVSRVALRRVRLIARSVSDLAVGGAGPDVLKTVMISELAEILTSVARTGDLVSRERQSLLVNRRRLESIAKFAPVVIFSFDRHGDLSSPLTYVSQNALQMLGYSTAEMLRPGWRLGNLNPEDKNACVESLPPGTATTREYRLRHKNGHYVWIYECVAVSDENADEAVGVMIDISERKRIAEQLGFTSKMESLGRIAAGIAHELNQPLQVIRMATQNIERRLRSSPTDLQVVQDKLEIVKGQVDRAAKIVRQVNSFGKPHESHNRHVLLGELLAETSSLLRIQGREANSQLVCDIVDPDLVVHADPLGLEQVIINLVQNAQHSILRRQKTSPYLGHIRLKAERVDGGVVITVDDDGTGIDPQELPYLFEPFFTTKSQEGGTGLGLSVSYGIIQEMGGRISAENTGEGARFTIWLREAATPETLETTGN